jgi:hypothetical protein
MQTHSLRVADARDQLEDLRAELLTFRDVLDVFSTGHADTLVVLCSGRPHPAEWAHALQTAGYTIPPRRHAGPSSGRLRPESSSSIPVIEPSSRAVLDAERLDAGQSPRERAGAVPRHGNSIYDAA